MKKLFKTVPVILVAILISSCSSVKVVSDYDKDVNFSAYQSFAFYKTGIDKAEISDLDKKRILRAIESQMLGKGFTKSENPDLLVSIFTKSREKVNVYNGPYGYGWGWQPYYWGGFWGGYGPTVTTSTEGMLYIDLIDAEKKELVWQGVGRGYLTLNREKKEERIKEFVDKIMATYPPGSTR